MAMGYDVYLVKAAHWFEEDNAFTPDECDQICRLHPTTGWLRVESTCISVKNPTLDQIVHLVRIAREFGWRVQGDNGEFYAPDGTALPTPLGMWPRPSLWQKLAARWRFRKARRAIARSPGTPFAIGDRVTLLHRQGGIVVEVDPEANHGLGSIKARFPDGAVLGGTFLSHGFEKEGKSG